MVEIQAELKRKDSAGALVDWKLIDDASNTDTGKSDPVVDAGARAKLQEIRDNIQTLIDSTPDVKGTWGYKAGASGTVNLTGTKKVRSVTAHCTTAGSCTINGGDSIPIPANVAFCVPIDALLTDPTFVFTGTDSYFIEYIT